MKLSNSYFFTLRENPKDEDCISAKLLVRSGMIKKISSGVYSYLPLGYRVFKNIENIIREEMDRIGCQEVSMPSLISEEIFEKSGRKAIIGSSMFSLKDRFNKSFCLGPTHEELFTIAAGMKIKSYKDLPFSLYQIQKKFRDELRPRFGLVRLREFVMKDSYTFDVDSSGLSISYNKQKEAYKKIFDRLNIKYKIVTADTGVMGGSLSEEFQALTDTGEDTLVICNKCGYASNLEVAESIVNEVNNEPYLDYELVLTENVRTIEEVSEFLKIDSFRFVKTLIYNVDGVFYAILVNGDDDVNELKVLKNLCGKEIRLATFEEVEEITNSDVGFAGPIGLKIEVLVDKRVLNMRNFVVGANKSNYHYINVNLKDFSYKSYDLRIVKENEECIVCNYKLKIQKGIEIGNIFKLDYKYSESMGLNYMSQNNELKPVYMGSYGIGIDRCIAAIIEQYSDEKGIVWTNEVAPYKGAIVVVNPKDELQILKSNELYNMINNMVLDDRNESFGIKLNDMELIGMPVVIVVGNKIKENIVELKYRDGSNKEINFSEILNYIN